MTYFRQVKIAFFLLSLALVVLVHSQDTTDQSNKKNISLHDPSVDQTVKSALEDGSVSEVVVRKDLLLFPVNAPNLVIAHTQEIHAVPQTNGTNTTDGKPTAAEVAEVNEYSLSQLVSTNDTDYDNETKSESSAVAASTLLRGPQNASVLEPGKLLEIVSGFNLSHGLATEKVALPDEVQNISIPEQSIAGLLSKSIQLSDTTMISTSPAYDFNAPQPDASMTSTQPAYDLNYPQPDASMTADATPLYSYDIAKRFADSEESNSTDVPAPLPPYPYIVRKRSIDSDEDDGDDDSSSGDDTADEVVSTIDNGNDSEKLSVDSEMDGNDNGSAITEEETTSTSAEVAKRSVDEDESPIGNGDLSTVNYEITSTSSTMPDTGLSDNAKMVRRSIDLDQRDPNSGSSSTTGYNYYNYKVENSLGKLDVTSTTNNSTLDSQPFLTNNGPVSGMPNVKEKLRDDSHENMEVAEDIVFRPLFRYRQETRLRQESAPYRKSGYRKSAYNTDDSEYDADYD